MFDVVVVGGGLVGCLTALHLADAGHRCVVLDRGDGMRTASHDSAGGIYLQLQPRFDAPEKVRNHGARLSPLIRASFPAWRRLLERIPGVPLRATGGVIVGFDAADMAALHLKHSIERSLGLDSILLSDDDIRHISTDFNPAIQGGCFVVNEGHCEPAPLMRMVREALHQRGVDVLPHKCVQNIEQLAHGVSLRLADGARMVSDRVVLATGGFTGAMLDGLHIRHGIRAFPIQMCSTSPSSVNIPVLTRAIGLKLSLKKPGDGVWVGGGWEADGFDHETQSTILSPRNERANLDAACRVVPALDAARVDRRWGGWVAWTRDGLPIVGACPGAPDVLMACGGNGFSLAPLYSELLAALTAGSGPRVDLSAFDPERFVRARPDDDAATDVLPD